MANYYGTTKSNDFLVNDKEKAELILSSIGNDGEFYYDVDDTNEEGKFSCWFGCYGNISGLPKNYQDRNDDDDDDDYDYDLMISELQSILVEGQSIQIVDIGYEKLRYVGGGCLVITKNNYEYIDLATVGDSIAEKLLSEDKKENN